VRAAAAAFPAWMDTPAVERARILFRLKVLLEGEFESLARSVTLEHGKTLVEARGDVRRGRLLGNGRFLGGGGGGLRLRSGIPFRRTRLGSGNFEQGGRIGSFFLRDDTGRRCHNEEQGGEKCGG